MSRYTAAELGLLATIMAWEADQRKHDQRERCQLPCPSFRPGLMGRVRGQKEDDGIDCQTLALKLQEHADEVMQQQVYR